MQQAQDGDVPDQTEIVITATKREERLQNVPMSVQAIGTRRLDQLNISNFEEYTKQLPSVSFNTSQSGGTVVYMRGVATGGDGNHSGSLPSVGVYLDEQPVTTIGGALDVHIYDIARIESLAGPQGTLYGASSEAGTIRIITNKPDLSATYGRVDGELNKVAHGGVGGKLEGMINMPIAKHIAFRGVAFYQQDAGLHRQCARHADLLRHADHRPIRTRRRSHRLHPQRHPRQQCRIRAQQHQHGQELWRPCGAEDRSRRQLDRHADDHAPILQAGRILRLRSDARRPQGPALPQRISQARSSRRPR